MFQFKDFAEFEKELLDKKILINHHYYDGNYDLQSKNITVERSLGGIRGGSCWGKADEHFPEDKEKASIYDLLKDVISIYCPQLPYFVYVRLKKEHVNISSKYESSYYGNYENFEVQKCSLTELFNLLKDYK